VRVAQGCDAVPLRTLGGGMAMNADMLRRLSSELY